MSLKRRGKIYVRVSTKDQMDGLSIPAQIRQCQDYAQKNNIDIIEVVLDGGESVKKDLGPNFRKMMKEAPHQHVDVIVTFSVDRLSRNPKGTQEIIDILEETEISLESVSERLSNDNPDERATNLHFHGLLAYFSNRERSKHMKKVKKENVYQGGINSTPATGYTRIHLLDKELSQLVEIGRMSDEQYKQYMSQVEDDRQEYNLKRNDVLPHPIIAPVIEKIFKLYAQGTWSPQEIARYLNENRYAIPKKRVSKVSGKTVNERWTRRSVADILRNPVYLGRTIFHGEDFDGRHPAIIDQELWDKCVEVESIRSVGIRAKAYPKDGSFPLAKIAFCPVCNGYMSVHRNGNGKRYYRDQNGKDHACDNRKLVPADTVHDELLSYLASISLPEDWRRLVIERMDINYDAKEAMREKRKLKEMLNRNKDLYRSLDISKEEFYAAKEHITMRIAALETVPSHDIEEAAQLLNHIGDLLKAATAQELGVVFDCLFEKVYLHRDYPRYICAIEPKPALHQLMDISELPKFANFQDNLHTIGEIEEETLVSDAPSTTIDHPSNIT
jgi:DNA invertase Pin-like site-specific DNA recombinase